MDPQSFIREYVDKMKNMQEIILEFLEENVSEENFFQKIISYFEDEKIKTNKHYMKSTLNLISKISDNHHRSLAFNTKIEQIIKIFENEIKKFFTNFDIFNIFKKNKRILLFLFEEKILIPDKNICKAITNSKYKSRNYPNYFFIEFVHFFNAEMIQQIKEKNPEIRNDIEKFKENRKKGENENYLCELIRNDSIDEFITFVNQSNLSHSDTIIPPSIYETNLFLLKNEKRITLIEYAAFFGSIQIFNYLQSNKVQLTRLLWFYSIHSQSSKLFHRIEENKIELPSYTIDDLYIESLKCHHIDMMNYIKSYFVRYEEPKRKQFNFFSKKIHFYNFIDLKNTINELKDMKDLVNDFGSSIKNIVFQVFYVFLKYDYYEIVNLLIKNPKLDINAKRIHKSYNSIMFHILNVFL